ncbi:MAG: hypothetical protein HC882_07255 [Acidobacteria bacterium]|nr:hypothetical protein [Acidobacteriota bacterium]
MRPSSLPSALLVCLIAISLPATAAEAPLSPPHLRIRDLVVDAVLGGRTEGVRVVATPVAIEPGDDVAFRWTMGEIAVPPGTAWFALADETPGVMGFHPVTHVFLDRDVRILETRPATYYPRFYVDGVRRGLTTLIEYRALPNPNPPARELIATPPGLDAGVDEFSYDAFHAVIIEGDVPSGSSYSEFWSDPVAMFRLLLEFGYGENNIHVLYGEGHDETAFACEYYREQMVDMPAYKQDVRNVFTWMKDGNASKGIARVTANDFVFLFTFDHGSGNAACEAQLCLMDGCMPDTEFASYFNAIPYKHRAVDMQQCNSGGFVDNLQNVKSVVSTAANCSESAYEADEQDDCGGGVSVKYGEWNYWWMSAMRGHKPWPGLQLVDADSDNDGKVSFLEAHNYALANDNRGEHPQWSDPGGIGDELSLLTTWDGVHLRASRARTRRRGGRQRGRRRGCRRVGADARHAAEHRSVRRDRGFGNARLRDPLRDRGRRDRALPQPARRRRRGRIALRSLHVALAAEHPGRDRCRVSTRLDRERRHRDRRGALHRAHRPRGADDATDDRRRLRWRRW